MEPAATANATPRQLRLSAVVLLLANAAPLLGVLFLQWSVGSVLILYWFENIVIGILNVAKMIVSAPANDSFVAALAAAPAKEPQAATVAAPSAQALKLIVIPFFIFHYFFFCAGHGIFIFSMFGSDEGYFGEPSGFGLLGALGRALEIFATPLALAALVLVVSHVISFFQNYIGAGEYKQLDLRKLMTMPYGRVVALHVTIIAGGFVTLALGQPVWALVVLVVVKTAVDLKMHLVERRKAQG